MKTFAADGPFAFVILPDGRLLECDAGIAYIWAPKGAGHTLVWRGLVDALPDWLYRMAMRHCPFETVFRRYLPPEINILRWAREDRARARR